MDEQDAINPSTIDILLEGVQLIGYDWKYLYVNDTVVKQSKYSCKEDLLGYTVMEKLPGIEATPAFKVLECCMSERKSGLIESEFTCLDGSSGWYELRIDPVPQGIFVLSVDINRRKKIEQDKTEYIEDLEKVIYLTSHKVRQPVAQILGFSELLNMPISSKSELEQISKYMKMSAITLDNFLHELHDRVFSMKQKAEKLKQSMTLEESI